MRNKIITSKIFLKRLLLIFNIIVLQLVASINNFTFGQDTLILAVHPYLYYQEIEKRFTPLADYLSHETGKTVILRVGKNFEDHIKAIGNDKVDIAFIGSLSYVQLTKQFGQKPLLASLKTNNGPFIYCKIITRTDSPLMNLSDLGKGDFALVDPESTMGYLVPMYLLLDLDNLSEIIKHIKFLGSHDNVAIGVLSGDYEAGAVRDEIYYKYQTAGLKELATTLPVPEHLFITRSNLSPQIIGQLQKALLNLEKNDAGQKILQNINPTITGMSGIKDTDFNEMRNILSVLEKNGLVK